MRLRHLINEGTRLLESVGTAPTDFAARIKAIPGWQDLDFLQSLLSQVQRGRTLSDKQVAALEKFEKRGKKDAASGGPLDPHLRDNILTVIARATNGIRGRCLRKYAARPEGYVKMVRWRILNKGAKAIEMTFDNGMDLLDFGSVVVYPNGDRSYGGISHNTDYNPEMRREFIAAAERALAGIVPVHSKATETDVKG